MTSRYRRRGHLPLVAIVGDVLRRSDVPKHIEHMPGSYKPSYGASRALRRIEAESHHVWARNWRRPCSPAVGPAGQPGHLATGNIGQTLDGHLQSLTLRRNASPTASAMSMWICVRCLLGRGTRGQRSYNKPVKPTRDDNISHYLPLNEPKECGHAIS